VRHLVVSAGVISALTLATNFLGFAREVLFARAFGAGREADAFVTAFSIVATSFLVFSAGSLQGAFMPRYQGAVVRGDAALARGLWRLSILVLSIVLSIVVVTIMLAAERLVALVVPGFDEAAKRLTAEILQWLAPMVFLVGLGALLQSVMHANQRFFLPALVPFFNNLVLIGALVLAVPAFGLVAFGYGTVLGAAVWLTLLPGVLAQLPRGPARLDLREFRGLLSAMLPLVVLLVADQLSGLAQKTFVSDLEAGSIAVLNYAARLEGLPVGVFAAAIAAVFFPALVESLAKRDAEAIGTRFKLGLAATSFFAVPATVFLVMESQLVVRVLFERGAFGPEASVKAADALRWYAVGLLPQSLIVYLNRVFFANRDTTTPMVIGVSTAALHVLICWRLVGEVGYLGIAMGTSLYALVYFFLLLFRLRGLIERPIGSLLAVAWRGAVAALPMAMLLWTVPFPVSITGLLVALATGVAVFLVFAFLLRDPVLTAWQSYRFVSASNGEAESAARYAERSERGHDSH
jgi:putative peptidoglycan lipid II flippase